MASKVGAVPVPILTKLISKCVCVCVGGVYLHKTSHLLSAIVIFKLF